MPLFHALEGIVYSNAIYFVEGTKFRYPLYGKCSHPKGIFKQLIRSNHLTLEPPIKKSLDGVEWFPEDMNRAEEYDYLRISYLWKADYSREHLVRYRIHKLLGRLQGIILCQKR